MGYGETRLRALAARVHGARRLGMALLLGAVALTAAPAPAVATQGDVIVTNYRYVTRIDATGARTILSGFSNPGQGGDFNLGDTLGVAMASNGDLFVADGGWFDSPTPSQLPESRFGDSGGIWRIDAKTGFRTPVSSNDEPVTPAAQNFSTPVGVAIEADGNLIVTDYGSTDKVFRVDPDTGDANRAVDQRELVHGRHRLRVARRPRRARGRDDLRRRLERLRRRGRDLPRRTPERRAHDDLQQRQPGCRDGPGLREPQRDRSRSQRGPARRRPHDPGRLLRLGHPRRSADGRAHARVRQRRARPRRRRRPRQPRGDRGSAGRQHPRQPRPVPRGQLQRRPAQRRRADRPRHRRAQPVLVGLRASRRGHERAVGPRDRLDARSSRRRSSPAACRPPGPRGCG